MMSDLHSEAMMVFDENTVGIWFYSTMPTQDFMASLREIKPDEEYELVYRFRYYDPESTDPFDGKDQKSWHRGRTKQTRAFAISGIRMVLNELHKASNYGKIYELLNDGDINEFFRKFQDLPFVYARQVPLDRSAGSRKAGE